MSNGLTERCNLIWSINYPAYVQKDQKIGSTIYQQIFYIVRPQREIKGSRILDLCMDAHWGDQWEFYENFGRYKLLLSFFFCRLKFNSLRQWTSHDFSIRIRSAIPMASARNSKSVHNIFKNHGRHKGHVCILFWSVI